VSSSPDYFRQELIAQMSKHTARGSDHVIVSAAALRKLVGGPFRNNFSMPACHEAMEKEMTGDDTIVTAKESGAGLTICYLLPRPV
jgi:hypothetical protein